MIGRALDRHAAFVRPSRETALFLFTARLHPLGEALLLIESNALDRLFHQRRVFRMNSLEYQVYCGLECPVIFKNPEGFL